MAASDTMLSAGVRLLKGVLNRVVRRQGRRPSGGPHPPQHCGQPSRQQPHRRGQHRDASGYPGDYLGRPRISYAPHDDRAADPGEIVWTWVPYEEDHSRGKDRPVLVIGRDDAWLLALQITSRDHDLDGAQEAARGRYWVDIGTGDWDAQGRASEVRVNRIIRVRAGAVRRIGAILDRERFDLVADEVLRHC